MHIDKSRVATTTIKLNTFAGTWIYERLKYWRVLELVYTIRIHYTHRDFRWLRPNYRLFRSHSSTSPTRSHSWFRREIDIFRSIDAGERVRLSFVVGQPIAGIKVCLPSSYEYTDGRTNERANASISAQCEKRKMEKISIRSGAKFDLYFSYLIDTESEKEAITKFIWQTTVINVGTTLGQHRVATARWIEPEPYGRPSFSEATNIRRTSASVHDRLFAVRRAIWAWAMGEAKTNGVTK